MFNKAAAAEPAPDVEVPPDVIPVSHLALDLPEPEFGWVAYLTGRGVAVIEDGIGRSAISSADARMLISEHRADEARKAEMRAESEKRAVEADREWRSQLPRGLPWYEVPDGVLPATAMLAADRAAQPRRTPSQNEWLFGEVDDTMGFIRCRVRRMRHREPFANRKGSGADRNRRRCCHRCRLKVPGRAVERDYEWLSADVVEVSASGVAGGCGVWLGSSSVRVGFHPDCLSGCACAACRFRDVAGDLSGRYRRLFGTDQPTGPVRDCHGRPQQWPFLDGEIPSQSVSHTQQELLDALMKAPLFGYRPPPHPLFISLLRASAPPKPPTTPTTEIVRPDPDGARVLTSGGVPL
jgi:hypothetical protein